jgi:DNA polymerase elongation subunit (family B)
MVAEVRGKLAVSKQTEQKVDVEGFNLKRLSEFEFRKQYQIKISSSFVAFENLNACEDIHRAWENVEDNIKISAKESKYV